MKLSSKIVNLFVFVLLISTSVCHGEDNLHDEISKDLSGVESLSPELRKLLTKEMMALQNGMMSIIPAYASGNWSEIEAIGSKMESNYILKQSLSEEQIKELHSSLPIQFIKLEHLLFSLKRSQHFSSN